ncbi:hypothetical protein DVG80_04585 [Rhodococcus erythropolis]|nr:hypothetical protein DVG80_04585 [Rhodococcus erythropolis]
MLLHGENVFRNLPVNLDQLRQVSEFLLNIEERSNDFPPVFPEQLLLGQCVASVEEVENLLGHLCISFEADNVRHERPIVFQDHSHRLFVAFSPLLEH